MIKVKVKVTSNISKPPEGQKNCLSIYANKKVLLRQRKRHTTHRVVSTPSVVLTGYPPSPDLARGVPWVMLQSIMGYGYPPSRCEQTNKVKLLPFRRTTYAGGKNCSCSDCSCKLNQDFGAKNDYI